MSYLDESVLDRGLFSVAKRATRLLVTESEASAYDAIAIGDAPTLVVGPQAAPEGGRQVTVSLAAPGAFTANGTAAHWALVDDAGEGALLAAGAFANPLAVEAGNSFSLSPFVIAMAGLH